MKTFRPQSDADAPITVRRFTGRGAQTAVIRLAFLAIALILAGLVFAAR